jgi:hypothetical protein
MLRFRRPSFRETAFCCAKSRIFDVGRKHKAVRAHAFRGVECLIARAGGNIKNPASVLTAATSSMNSVAGPSHCRNVEPQFSRLEQLHPSALGLLSYRGLDRTQSRLPMGTRRTCGFTDNLALAGTSSQTPEFSAE